VLLCDKLWLAFFQPAFVSPVVAGILSQQAGPFTEHCFPGRYSKSIDQ